MRGPFGPRIGNSSGILPGATETTRVTIIVGMAPSPIRSWPSSTTLEPAAGRAVHGARGTRMPRASSATRV